MKDYSDFSSIGEIFSSSRPRRFALAFLTAALLAGCGDDSKSTTTPTVECTDDAQCVSRTDGKTKCDTTASVCVTPDKECASDAQCKDRTDGKTKCDTAAGVCINPNVECTSDAQCKDRTDGKTKCDTLAGVCVPSEKECSGDADCAGNTADGRIKCNTEENVCYKPECSADADCVSNSEGKYKCDTDKGLCISVCGNGTVDTDLGETCEASDLNDMTCATLPESNFLGGDLACDSLCHFDTKGCYECTEQDLSKCPSDRKSCKDGLCVIPGAECYGNEDCADNTDGRTKCKTETGECIVPCGDGFLDEGESCDQTNLGGATCNNLPENKYVSGTLVCNSLCEFDKSRCLECTDSDVSRCPDDKKRCSDGVCVSPEHVITCGDGKAEGTEKCDPGTGSQSADFRGFTCMDFGYVSGDLACEDNCMKINYDGCAQCSGKEDCEGIDICDDGQCVTPEPECGNGILEQGEICDKNELNGQSCDKLGYAGGGDLRCNAGCNYDTTGCRQCNNKGDCQSGFVCSEKGICIPEGHTITCGDSLVEGSEACDKYNLNGKTCADMDGFAAGRLACTSNCTFDTKGCYECESDVHCKNNTNGKIQCDTDAHKCVVPAAVCGNGRIEDAEKCDKSDLGGTTCKTLGYVAGDLKCNSSCEFDESQCLECTSNNDCKNKPDNKTECISNHCVEPTHVVRCGDGIVEETEVCDDGDDSHDLNLNGQTCVSQGFGGGDLGCRSCKFDTTGCKECVSSDQCKNHPQGYTLCSDGVCVAPVASEAKIVISQIYPGGANDGSTYKTKYVELFNRSTETVVFKDWSIQYASKDGTSINSVCELTDEVKLEKGQYYLIELKSDKGDADLPQKADFTCESAKPSSSATDGKFFLVNSKTKLSSTSPASGYVDAIGYGSANWSEGMSAAATRPKMNKTTAAFRNNFGCDDTNINSADFSVATPAPRYLSSKRHPCDGSIVGPTCNGVLEEGEVCDGAQFQAGKTAACSDWGDYNQGNVLCNNCQIDTTNCVKIVEEECNTAKGQEWSNKYATCVYNINTKDDFYKFAQEYRNGTFVGTYPGHKFDAPVFVLNADIDATSSWLGIGNSSYAFDGTFYGEGHTIKVDGDARLFYQTANATIQDLIIQSERGTLSDRNEILAYKVDGGTIKNITIKGSYYAHRTSSGAARYVVIAEVNDATIENIDINLQVDIDLYSSMYKFSHFVGKSTNSNYRKISIHGSSMINDASSSGLAYTSSNDTWSDCVIDFAVTTSYAYSYPLFEYIENKTTLDNINITPNYSVANTYSCALIYDSKSCSDCRISNLQDHSKYSKPSNVYLVYKSGTHIQLANASIYGNYGALSSTPTDLLLVKVSNVLFGNISIGGFSVPTNDVWNYVYFKDDTVSAADMNQHLADKTGIPSGKYLPWKAQDGRIVLNFDASESQMYVVP